jgi:hypothetical protein
MAIPFDTASNLRAQIAMFDDLTDVVAANDFKERM